MQQTEFKEFCQLLDDISEQYKPLSEGAKVLYWQGLVNYDLSAIKLALFRHLRNPDVGQFMPKISDVVRMLQGSTLDSALAAWAKVDQAVRHVGTYDSVVFDDAIIHKVLQDMGGWIGLSQKTDSDWPFVAKEFENRYRGFKARGEALVYPRVLIGAYEASNGHKGHKAAPPILIGNKAAAELVHKGGSNKPALQFTQANELTFKPLLSLINANQAA